ncbi:hypothetical protein F2Q70_00011916 [Brassica cretica]|uniref:Uncharacterized protein n=1 Tax=Brassica cretica TaxID=69181 RepID=A0A8S9M5Q0_BRACR|nr:hypothetical protein F2Q70_00011916 [Brassica cretica]
MPEKEIGMFLNISENSWHRRRDRKRKLGPCKIKGKSYLKREVSQKDTYLQKKKPEYPSKHPDPPLCIMLKVFWSLQSSRLCRLQDTIKSPELLHLRQDISGSRKIAPDPGLLSGNRSSPGFRVWLQPEWNPGQ